MTYGMPASDSLYHHVGVRIPSGLGNRVRRSLSLLYRFLNHTCIFPIQAEEPNIIKQYIQCFSMMSSNVFLIITALFPLEQKVQDHFSGLL